MATIRAKYEEPLLLKRPFILENKTIAEWMQDVRGQAHHFTNKYERCFGAKRYSIPTMHFYRKARDIYFSLFEVLQHLDKYNAIVDKTRCQSCKFSSKHTEKLELDFKRWYPFIMRCRDGFHYTEQGICNALEDAG